MRFPFVRLERLETLPATRAWPPWQTCRTALKALVVANLWAIMPLTIIDTNILLCHIKKSAAKMLQSALLWDLSSLIALLLFSALLLCCCRCRASNKGCLHSLWHLWSIRHLSPLAGAGAVAFSSFIAHGRSSPPLPRVIGYCLFTTAYRVVVSLGSSFGSFPKLKTRFVRKNLEKRRFTKKIVSETRLKLTIVSETRLKLKIVSESILKLTIVSVTRLKLTIVSENFLKLRIVSENRLALQIFRAHDTLVLNRQFYASLIQRSHQPANKIEKCIYSLVIPEPAGPFLSMRRSSQISGYLWRQFTTIVIFLLRRSSLSYRMKKLRKTDQTTKILVGPNLDRCKTLGIIGSFAQKPLFNGST